jgi:transglutaminase-like putative cysteine protease
MSIVARRAPRGGRAALATGLVAFGTCASTLALGNLLSRPNGRPTIWLGVILLAGLVAGVRALTRTWWLPSLVGFVAAWVAIVLRYGAPPGRIQLVPDVEAWDRTRAAWSDGLTTVDTSVVPLDVSRPVELVLLVGALLVFLVADLLAVALGRAAWVGLAYIAMWTPALYLGFGVGGGALLWTGGAYLLLLALTAAPSAGRAERGRLASAALWSTAAVVVGALVLGPVLAAVPGWSSIKLPSFGAGNARPVKLSDQLDLRRSLGQRSSQTVLTYSVRAVEGEADDPTRSDEPTPSASATRAASVGSGSVGPLRAFTLTQFDGEDWTPTAPTATGEVSPGLILSPDPTVVNTPPSADRGVLAQVDVTVGALDETRLPIAIFPRTIESPGRWQYDGERDEVFGSSATTSGLQYSMIAELPPLTSEDLVDAPTPEPPGAEISGVLDVPETSHTEDVAELAREITADAATPYQQAMDLQTYLRSTANFTYDVRVAPASSDDAVWDFLQDKHGYCVQFATAMTIMSRTLGIPARMGIGFLPGRADGNGSIVVTGKEAHAWPELYFGTELGWVRFEPTPAVQSGAPPVWSDPFQQAAPGQNPQDNLVPTGRAQAPGDEATDDEGNPTTTRDRAGATNWVPVGITITIVLVLALVAGFVALSHQRRRVDLSPEAAWARMRRALGARGVRWSDATTPRAAIASIQAQLSELTGHELEGQAAASLESLSRVVEQDRYAPTEPDVDPDVLEGWVGDITDAVRVLVSDRPRRGAAPSAPRGGS